MDAVTRPSRKELADGLTVGDGLQEMLTGALGALRGRSGSSARPTADSIHRFRVGLRRLRSILSAFSDAFPEAERRALSDRLRAVAQRYGRSREWDVFLAYCVAPLRQSLPEDQTLGPLERQARQARRLAMPPGETLRGSFAEIETAVTAAPWLRRPSPELRQCWERPLRDFGAELLAARHRRLRKRVKTVDLADPVAFHQLRIRVKKMRYTSELVRSLFDEDLAKKYLRRLVELQDLMGRMNDARVAGELLRSLAPVPAAAPLVAGWLAHEIAVGSEQFPDCARSFRRADPFWEN
jgi:CHAD domain-containing protein